THTSLYGGKWYIDDSDLNEFYNLYVREIENGKIFYLTERHQDTYSPIIIDFDFRYNKKYDESPITINIIDKIVDNITKIIKEAFSNDENFTCIVTKRPNIYKWKDDIYKDGIHIMFPYIVTKYEFQYVLREKYLDIMQEDIKDIPFLLEK